uniref:Uncharacterized protein n=1 Tax=Glossina palpalis gambiensis TaxID=67801 RepID=A0A1B0BX80_9MUSC
MLQYGRAGEVIPATAPAQEKRRREASPEAVGINLADGAPPTSTEKTNDIELTDFTSFVEAAPQSIQKNDVSELDIFAEAGDGTAHHEYVFFTVILDKFKYKEEVSNVRNNLVRFDFMKCPYDNPKMNAFILLKRDVQRIPRLKSLHKDTFYRDIEDSASIRGANKKKVLNGQHRKLVSNEEDTETDEYRKKLPALDNEEDING